MDGREGTVVFPLHCCKIIHLVRHAQGTHNVKSGDSYEAYLTSKYFDAELTPLGWQQVDKLHKYVDESGISKRIELVVVSPLLRALQTAAGVFGGAGNADGLSELPLMVSNAGNSGRPAISSLNCPPFVAYELCRERICHFTFNKRRNISDYQILFPAIDFSLIESDEDILWKPDKESTEQLTARVQKFIRWLWTRQEKEIAIVSHGSFLKNVLITLGNDLPPSLQSGALKKLQNSELRSFIIVDRSATGSGSSLNA